MNPDFTAEQNSQLLTWVDQRDALLSELAVLRDEKQVLLGENTQLRSENSLLIQSINENKGRIAEIEANEEERGRLISIDLVNLNSNKTKLEVTVSYLQNEVEVLHEKKINLKEDIKHLKEIHNDIFDKTSVLNKVVDHVVRVSQENLQNIEKATRVSL